MKKLVCLLLFSFSVNSALPLPVNTAAYFVNKHPSCFLIKKIGEKKSTAFNNKQCMERFEPHSTFKILNSLIALETGVLKYDAIIPWDKSPKAYRSWEKDHTLRTAIKNSVVPFYQEVARRVGLKKMKEYLKFVNFGNNTVGEVIDRFWLDGPLKISAYEQLEFIENLYTKKLPFKKEYQDFVIDILRLEQNKSKILSGKTGSKFVDGVFQFGWFVGHIEKASGQYVFVANSKGVGESGRKIKKAALKILNDMGI